MDDLFGAALPTLQTPRLSLRHPRPADTSDLFAIFSDPVAMRYWSTLPMREPSEAEQYLRGIDEGFADRSLLQWAIALPDSDRLIGTVTLHNLSPSNKRAEIGYMLSPKQQGQGYATEAVFAVLVFAFERMNLHRIEADLHPDNAASVRLVERLGFAREGYLRERWFVGGVFSDSLVYGLLRGGLIEPERRSAP